MNQLHLLLLSLWMMTTEALRDLSIILELPTFTVLGETERNEVNQ